MDKKSSSIQWFLEGEMRDNSPWVIPVHHNSFFIGRLNSSDLIISSSSVSRKHAELILINDDLYIKDLNSKNGTFVNGRQLNGKNVLHDGDLLKIGFCGFKIFSKKTIAEEERNNTLIEMNDESDKSFSDFHHLSLRESEVLYFLIKGLSLQIIGEKLFISPGTVKNHVLKIYKKTKCHSRIELSTKYSEHKKMKL